MERERLGPAGETAEHGFGFDELVVGEPCDRFADAGVAAERLDFEHLPLDVSLRTRGETLADTLSAEPTRKTISPEGFMKGEMTNADSDFMTDLPRQLANPKWARVRL